MKYLITLLSIIILSSSVREDFSNRYNTLVNEAYSEYIEERHEHPNYDYGITLVKGIIKNEVRYGFSFYSENAKSYYIRVYYNGNLYEIDSDSRGDVQVVALNLKEGDVFSLEVFEAKSNTKEALPEYENIEIMTKAEFYTLESRNFGQGKGVSLTKLKTPIKIDSSIWLYLAAFMIISGCGVVVFVYYKKRKGLFAPEIRSQNVFNFRDFLNSSFEMTKPEDEGYEEGEAKEMPAEPDPNYIPVENYPWSRVEDESSGFNIGEYLRDRGYITDYNLLSEEEKNNIMIELMYLRDQKKITKDEYLEEASKLWKK
ncbi:MAG: hypothetical protein GX661_01630 [Acholeplasmataceae bacterium]|jgi:hypothetical protein|nr:hypothetical protein [Acholeplasmataceae bacterium]